MTEHLHDVVALTRRLVGIGARSGNEAPVASMIEETMRGLGYRDIRRDRLGNVFGSVGPAGGRPAVLFDSHTDVVGVNGTWSLDPFAGEIRDGRLYGRGTTDMKGALAASLIGVARAAATGGLKRAVTVSATVLEETVEGGALGEVLDAVQPDCVVICEPSSLKVKIGQRGRVELLVQAKGIPAHAAHPEHGRNPILLASEAIRALQHMPLPRDAFLGEANLVATDIVSDPYPLVSALPETVTVRFDRRTVLGETKESVIGEIKELLRRIDPEAFTVWVNAAPVTTYTGQTVAWERDLRSWYFDRDTALPRLAKRSLEAVGLDCTFDVYAFCTNGSESAGRRGIPTVGYGPGDPWDAHIVDESISIDQLNKSVDAYSSMALVISAAQEG